MKIVFQVRFGVTSVEFQVRVQFLKVWIRFGFNLDSRIKIDQNIFCGISFIFRACNL